MEKVRSFKAIRHLYTLNTSHRGCRVLHFTHSTSHTEGVGLQGLECRGCGAAGLGSHQMCICIRPRGFRVSGGYEATGFGVPRRCGFRVTPDVHLHPPMGFSGFGGLRGYRVWSATALRV